MQIVASVDEGLGNSSYVVDLGDGQGAVIDPERDPSPYLAIADERNLRLRWAVETHLHADFISGGRELIAQGAQLISPAGSKLAFDHTAVEDDQDIDLGGLTLSVLATPGHTPEHLSYLLKDGATPLALFSGGTLMAGGVARTDLVSPEMTDPLARLAYRSIHERLLTLPDDLPVYPTHGAGSFCSAAPTGQRTTTIGAERRANPLLQAWSEDDFVDLLIGGLGTHPPYFLKLRDLNQAGPRVFGRTAPVPDGLAPGDVAGLASRGAVIIDIRRIAAFAQSHIPGAVSIELRSQFATWLGWLVDLDRPIILVGDPDQDVGWAIWEARKVGQEQIVGVLDGGMAAWEAAGFETAEIPLVAAADIDPDAELVDVRQASEWLAGHVPSAHHTELGTIADDPSASGVSGPTVLHCGHGQRAMTAASLLARAGTGDLLVTADGPSEIIANAEGR